MPDAEELSTMFGPSWVTEGAVLVTCGICGAVVPDNDADKARHYDYHPEKDPANLV
jgi:hypothetical protein